MFRPTQQPYVHFRGLCPSAEKKDLISTQFTYIKLRKLQYQCFYSLQVTHRLSSLCALLPTDSFDIVIKRSYQI